MELETAWRGHFDLVEAPLATTRIGKTSILHRPFRRLSGQARLYKAENAYSWRMHTDLEAPFDKIAVRLKRGRRKSTDEFTITPSNAGRPETWPERVEFSVDGPDHLSRVSQQPEVVRSHWHGQFRFNAEDIERGAPGLRPPQLGALHALCGHLSVGEEPEIATIVLPTGTGKTETMLAALAYRRTKRLLVLVPSDALRQQTARKIASFGLLRDLQCMPDAALNPSVAIVRGGIASTDEAQRILSQANVVVALPDSIAASAPGAAEALIDGCDELFIDEAHHVSATRWQKIRERFNNKPVVQFTATPFRQDGKPLGGKIIFNYRLSQAQRDGYYRPIRLFEVEEFGDQHARDLAIARRAIDALRQDLDAGHDHLLMARVARVELIEPLMAIYRGLAPDLNPMEVYSGSGRTRRNREVLQHLRGERDPKCRIILCVDMLGEGFDLPQLKLSAIHSLHKSLAITLQFIGRFTRSADRVGDAGVIVNTADETIENKLKQLYSQGADWDRLISRLSEDRISTELNLQTVVEDLTRNGTLAEQISLWNLRPSLSTQLFRTTCEGWRPEAFRAPFPHDAELWHAYAPNEELLVVVGYFESGVRWGRYEELKESAYGLLLAHWDKDRKVLCVNSSNYDLMKAQGVAEAIIGEDAALICGPDVFNVLNGVELPLAKSLGSSRVGAISFTSYFGPNVTEGLASVEKSESELNNIACLGYENGDRVVWGAAQRKGKIWQHDSATIADWKTWAIGAYDKVSDVDAEQPNITKDFLRPTSISEFPEAPPISIQWGEYLQTAMIDRVAILFGEHETPIAFADMSIIGSDAKTIRFAVESDDNRSEYKLSLTSDDTRGYRYERISGPPVSFRVGGGAIREFDEQVYKDPPIIRYADGTFSYNNFLIPVKLNAGVFPSDRLEVLDWGDIDIAQESIGKTGRSNCVQFRAYELFRDEYAFVFNDDGKGEAADLVCLRDVSDDEIELALIHCKYAIDGTPSARIDNLYEVCGQAQKCIVVKHEGLKRLQKSLTRRQTQWSKQGASRLLKGGLGTLSYFVEKSRKAKVSLRVAIVQPGLSAARITDDIGRLLATTELFLKRTTEAEFQIICSA